MAIIDDLKDKSGDIIYPRTLTKAIYTEDTSERLDNILTNKVDSSRVLTDVPANAKFTDTNTTYSEISEAEINTGTASTLRTMTARRITFIINKIMGVVSGELNNKVDKGQPFTWGNLKNGL